MALTANHERIQELRAKAENETLAPDTRMLAARELLELTNFSDRSSRLSKRLSKTIKKSGVSDTVKKRAENLFNFTIAKKTDVPTDVAASPNVVSEGEASTLASENRGWDALPVPRKFISYYMPEDLPAFGIPADPELASLPHREGETLQIATDAGGIYFVEFGDLYIGGKNKNSILNPLYVKAYEAWKIEHPGGEPFFGDKPAPADIFNYEYFMARYNVNGLAPVFMMFRPVAPSYVKHSS